MKSETIHDKIKKNVNNSNLTQCSIDLLSTEILPRPFPLIRTPPEVAQSKINFATDGEADDAESLNERQHLGEGRLAGVPLLLQGPHRLLNLVLLEREEKKMVKSVVQ